MFYSIHNFGTWALYEKPGSSGELLSEVVCKGL